MSVQGLGFRVLVEGSGFREWKPKNKGHGCGEWVRRSTRLTGNGLCKMSAEIRVHRLLSC